MYIRKIRAALLALLLTLSGCGDAGCPSSEPAGEEISLSALFQTEEGSPLLEGTVRFSFGEYENCCPLSSSGEISVSGLPRNGELLLTLLGNKEFQMLELLMRQTGRLISTEQFMEHIWGYDSDAEINVVWAYISYLRRKLEAVGANVGIAARRGQGYLLEEIL